MLKARAGLSVLLLLGISAAAIYVLYTGYWPLYGRKVVTSKTIVIQEEVFLCGDCRTVYYGPAPALLIGLGEQGLVKKYPAREGWAVVAKLPGELRVARHIRGLCPRHRTVRHLGLYKDHLAVYAGPLGASGRLLRVERIPVSVLSPVQREKLLLAAEFEKQPPDIQAMLRRDLEFPDEATVLAVLENLDELQD
mgnify:CR=1 FL=1